MYLDSTLRLGAIHVIQSLRPGDVPTGERLVDEVLTPATLEHPGLQVRFHRADTPEALLRALAAIAEVAESGVKPVVHIEAHADESGLQVTSDAYVPWPALTASLTRINAATGLHLLVVMAMCHGFHLSHVLLPMEAAPAWLIIGPNDSVRADSLYEAMAAFYRGLLVHDDADRALSDMNRGRPVEAWPFNVMSAEWLFCESFRKFVSGATPEARRALEDEIVSTMVERRGADDPTIAERAHAHARVLFADHRWYFDLLKERYFMFDQWPANRERFRLRFEDCAGPGSAAETAESPDQGDVPT